jgi:hypothetical protein
VTGCLDQKDSFLVANNGRGPTAGLVEALASRESLLVLESTDK